MPKVMPRQKPGESVQEVGTPRDFLDAVEKRFGLIGLDLAANADNHIVPLWLGPGSPLHGGEDALAPSVSWSGRSLRFLNPPFGDIEPCAAKCATERHHAFVGMLVPASIGADWFREHVHGKAFWLALSPRIKFVGHLAPFPRDLIFCLYGPLVVASGYDCWRWRT